MPHIWNHANLSLVFGLAGGGAMFLAMLADYWLYTVEPMPLVWSEVDGAENSTDTTPLMTTVLMHSGLWRACTFMQGKVTYILRIIKHVMLNI